MQLASAEEIRRVEKGMTWLATTGSVTPFIGLFGTVWGIIDAFSGLGNAGAASLRAVAPGIAEALITTAAGQLFCRHTSGLSSGQSFFAEYS